MMNEAKEKCVHECATVLESNPGNCLCKLILMYLESNEGKVSHAVLQSFSHTLLETRVKPLRDLKNELNFTTQNHTAGVQRPQHTYESCHKDLHLVLLEKNENEKRLSLKIEDLTKELGLLTE